MDKNEGIPAPELVALEPPLTRRKDPATGLARKGGVVAAAIAGTVVLSPRQVAVIRGKISGMVTRHLETVDQVIEGTRKWDPTQARLFTSLLNKVVPDLNASFHQHEIKDREVMTLSREDLERIASGVEAQVEADAVQLAAPTMEDPTDDRD